MKIDYGIEFTDAIQFMMHVLLMLIRIGCIESVNSKNYINASK